MRVLAGRVNPNPFGKAKRRPLESRSLNESSFAGAAVTVSGRPSGHPAAVCEAVNLSGRLMDAALP